MDKSYILNICVDDFAIRKRFTYVTIMVSLDTQQIIALLPLREKQAVQKYLIRDLMLTSIPFCFRINLSICMCSFAGALSSFHGRVRLLKNWQIIDSKQGAEASAMYYSIAETVKANGLKPHEYFRYVLEQMLQHLDDKPEEYISDLVQWSDKLPENCKKRNK